MKNWLSFKRQENGDYVYSDGKLEISYSPDGLLRCVKNGQVVLEKQYGSSVEAMMNTADVYEEFK